MPLGPWPGPAAVWLAYSGAAGQTPSNFARLWLVPTRTSGGTATLGVRNDHGATERFTVSLERGTQAAGNWQLTLAAGQAWQQDVPVVAGQSLRATLSQPGRAGAPQVVVLRAPPAPTGPLPSSTTPAPPSQGMSPDRRRHAD